MDRRLVGLPSKEKTFGDVAALILKRNGIWIED